LLAFDRGTKQLQFLVQKKAPLLPSIESASAPKDKLTDLAIESLKKMIGKMVQETKEFSKRKCFKNGEFEQ
jgi:hypothetical protein